MLTKPRAGEALDGGPVAVVALSAEGRVVEGNRAWNDLAARSPALVAVVRSAAQRACWEGRVLVGPERFAGLDEAFVGIVYPRAGADPPDVHAVVHAVGPAAVSAMDLVDALTEAGVHLAAFDRDLRFTFVNASFAELSGRASESIRGQPIAAVHPVVEPTIRELVGALGATGGVREFYPAPFAREGLELRFLLGAAPGGQADLWALGWATTDAPLPRVYRLAMLAGRVGLYDLDVARGVIVRSSGIDGLVGLTAEPSAPGDLWWLDRVHPDDRARVEARLAAWRSGQPAERRLCYRIERANGSWAHVADVADLVYTADGRRVRAVGALHDETAEQHALEALRRSETRFRLATLATTDAVYDWELASGQIQWSSLERFGYEVSPEMGSVEWWTDHIHPDDVPRVAASLSRAFASQTEALWRETYRFRRADGTWAQVADRGYLDREEGRMVRMVGAMADVTEQEEARRELEARVAERTAALAAANLDLEAFSYRVSHDLRAPLRAIAGFGAALEQRFDDQLPPEAREWIGRMRAAAERMGRLIHDLLDLARVARAPLVRAPVELGRLAADVVEDLRAHEPGRSVSVTIGEMPPAQADATLARCIVQNLLQNAWKFSRIRDIAHIDVGAITVGDEVRYFVRDDGIGFEAAETERLFEPFERLAGVASYEGAGIGLSTAARAVQRHGGRIWAESTPGAGATFWFTLPS